VKILEHEGQPAIGAAAVFHQSILDVIELNDYDGFQKWAYLPPGTKYLLFLSCGGKSKRFRREFYC
jgi:hypothetical protein